MLSKLSFNKFIFSSSFRYFSLSSKKLSRGVVYEEHGDPSRVLKLQDLEESYGGMHIDMLAATVNHADINMIQGNYGALPSLPAVVGNEGVGIVRETDSDSFAVGDLVIHKKVGFGTWRTDYKCDSSHLIRIPYDLPIEYLAGISSNPCTAYCVLRTILPLDKGDTVIQNAANSSVGQCITQIAKVFGYNVINVIRARETQKETNALIDKMKSYGADNIITEDELVKPSFNDKFKNISKPLLAVNSVGGSSATNIAKRLDTSGCMVTIGGMSKKPILIPTGAMIFKNLTFKGFWMTKWIETHTIEERLHILNSVGALMNDGALKLSFESVPFENYQDAIKKSLEERKDKKIVLKMKDIEVK